MKQKEVEIDGRYEARVSGRLVAVRIVRVLERSHYQGQGKVRTTIGYEALNEATGRIITIKSAAKLREKLI